MCGIAGIFAFGSSRKEWPVDVLNGMLRAVQHRGPDGEGTHVEPGFYLSHARLAVLDLSASGLQPMQSHNGRYVVSYNGEIYNFRELKKELEQKGHQFTSRSDTEVLLASWCEWGESALERLDGIFAFALYDRYERVLWLARDHMGVKPLFYHIVNDSIFFASELLALFGSINPCPQPDPADLDSYFTFNFLPAPRTGLKGVRQLEPATCLRVDAGGCQQRSYWSPSYAEAPLSFSPETVEAFRETLNRSVSSQMIADVPVGVFLSGGLDSYSVALAAVRGGNLAASFTLGFKEPAFDESPAAVEYADYLNISDRVCRFAWNESVIEKTLAAMGELLADASCFPSFQLAEFARHEVTVALAGDGGDELLAGYDTYRAGTAMPFLRAIPGPLRQLAQRVACHLPVGDERYGMRMIAERLLNAAEAGPGRDHATMRAVLNTNFKRRLYHPDFMDAVGVCDAVGDYAGAISQAPEHMSHLAACMLADRHYYLPSVLAKVDRMSMAHGLEVRVPFLSRRMIDLCINLDDACLMSWTRGKRILRSSLAGSIPPTALQRPKAGFIPPVNSWFRGDGPMNTIFGDLLGSARGKFDVFSWDDVERFWQDHRQGRVEGGFVLLGILQYINWSIKCAQMR